MKGEAVEGRVGLPLGVTLFRNTLNSAAVPGDKEKTNLIYWNTRPKKQTCQSMVYHVLLNRKVSFQNRATLFRNTLRNATVSGDKEKIICDLVEYPRLIQKTNMSN